MLSIIHFILSYSVHVYMYISKQLATPDVHVHVLLTFHLIFKLQGRITVKHALLEELGTTNQLLWKQK